MKYECIGHYQKRVGNRLRNLRKKTKGLGGKNKKSKVVDVVSSQKHPKKVMKAKSRLTNSLIDKLQNYFGIALRSNVRNIKDMQNAILTSMFHVASSYDDNYHTYCPKTSDPWCQHNRDIVNKTNLCVPVAGVSVDIIEAIKPVYRDLTKPDVLGKCLKTQMRVLIQQYGSVSLKLYIAVWK